MIEQECVGNISQEDLDEKGKRKRHHYLPIWLQKGFTDDDGLLWTADKNQGEPKRIGPKILFAENWLNQVRDPDTSDGQLRVMLDGEDAFSELDGVFSRTVRSVLERTVTAAAARRTIVDMDRGNQGYWSDIVSCPAAHYVCGLRQLVESTQQERTLYSGMNGIEFHCCPLEPEP